MATTAPTRRARCWRRRLTRAALCLLLGAVTTAGVAWGAVLVHPWGAGHYNLWAIEKDGAAWLIMIYEPRGPIHQVASQVKPTGMIPLGNGVYELRQPFASFSRLQFDDVDRRTIEQLPDTPIMATAFAQWQGIAWAPSPSPSAAGQQGPKTWACAIGWPALALTGAWTEPPPSTPAAQGSWRGMVNTNNPEYAMPAVPLRPGFLLDTLFYAAPWWALLATPGAIKRWRRRRRGACIACGYDLRGLGEGAACPECGRAARVAARRRPALSDDC